MITITNYATIGGTHLCGDAEVPDGRKFRFVMQDGEIDRLFLYGGDQPFHGDKYGRRNFANTCRRLATDIAAVAMPLLPEALRTKEAAEKEREAKATKELIAHQRAAQIRAAGEKLVEALEGFDEWHDLIKQNHPDLFRAFANGRRVLVEAGLMKP